MATFNCTQMGFLTKHIYTGNHCRIARIITNVTLFLLKDLGDHSESAYSVQTSDGEAICRLIAGYADILTAQKSSTLKDEDKVAIVTEELKMDQHAG